LRYFHPGFDNDKEPSRWNAVSDSSTMHKNLYFPKVCIHYDFDVYHPSQNSIDTFRTWSMATSSVSSTPSPPTPTHIYVSRISQNARQKKRRNFMNESDLIAALVRMGFCIIEPENLTKEDCFRIFAGARMVVGPSGAGLFNCIFCAPGTTVVDIECAPDCIPGHSSLFSNLQLDYHVYVAQALTAHSCHPPFIIDVDKFITFLKKILM
jgi:capsular polysaccharide biosynthesis protein